MLDTPTTIGVPRYCILDKTTNLAYIPASLNSSKDLYNNGYVRARFKNDGYLANRIPFSRSSIRSLYLHADKYILMLWGDLKENGYRTSIKRTGLIISHEKR